MKRKREKREGRGWLGAVGLAGLAAGAFGAALLLRRRHDAGGTGDEAGTDKRAGDRWARPGMCVTFRAELMPGRSSAERTYRVAQLLSNDRVTLEGAVGEHSETEFEPLR